MTAVLVTGAGGFIGSHLTEALVREGARVRAFVRYTSTGSWGWLDTLPPDVRGSLEVIRGDLKDADAVRRAVRGVEVVYHLGAVVAIPYSYVHPVDFVQTNVLGTAHVLQACHEFSARLVHTSTSEVYGTAVRVPIDEDHPLQAQSPYAATKTAADQLARSFHRSFGLPVVTVRPFNTYGPRQSARAVIPTVVTQALTGDRVRLGRLDPARDLTYVDDTVRGFLLAGRTEKAAGEVLNLGQGEAITIGALAERILALMGSRATIEADAERVRPEASEVMNLVSDARRAGRVLGWAPAVSLDEGLRRTIAWIRDHLERYRPGVYSV